MSSNFHRRLHIEITVNPENPELLTGLDVWLRLGLISEEQVNWLSRTYLTCPLPEVPKIPESESNFAPETIPREAETKLPRFTTPRVLQTLKNELNLVLISTLKERWLLFLGLFLVVISSGVMAANYWQNFPAALQYGILSTYTLVFWGVGFWASKQQNLQLTAQTLQNLTILLLPVNFWAMDTFHLWGNIWGWLTVAIASFLLTIIYLSQKTNKPLPLLLTFLILSYLHWGWNIPDFPLIAVTGGAILSALISLRFSQGNFIIYTLSVLLVRAIFVAHLPIQQLGLTLGICGWLLSRNGLTPPSINCSSFPTAWSNFIIIRLVSFCGGKVSFASNYNQWICLTYFNKKIDYILVEKRFICYFSHKFSRAFLTAAINPNFLITRSNKFFS